MTKTTSINPFILHLTKNSAEPTRPPFIHKLPTEIISQILELAIELAIDPIVTPMQEQWNQINQSIVCRDWYPIRKVRNKFVLLSTRQIRIMVKMIEKGEINIEGVKELIISFVNHQSQSKTAKSDAIASIIRICPRVERLTLKLKSIYDRWLTREKSLLPYVFDDLRKLSLKSFSCRSHVDVEELTHWTGLEELEIGAVELYEDVKFPPFTAPLRNLILHDVYPSLEFLDWLTYDKPLKTLHLPRCSDLPFFFHSLERIVARGIINLSVTTMYLNPLKDLLSKPNKLEQLAVDCQELPYHLPMAMENLPSLKHLILKDYRSKMTAANVLIPMKPGSNRQTSQAQ